MSFVVPNVLRLCVIVILKDQTAKDKALQHMAAMSSAQIVSATAIHNKLGLPGIPRPTFPGAPGVSHYPGPKKTPAFPDNAQSKTETEWMD